MKLLALVMEEPKSIARYLQGIGEPTDVPKRKRARGPRYSAGLAHAFDVPLQDVEALLTRVQILLDPRLPFHAVEVLLRNVTSRRRSARRPPPPCPIRRRHLAHSPGRSRWAPSCARR